MPVNVQLAPLYRNQITIEPVCSCKTVIGHIYPLYRAIYIKRLGKLAETSGYVDTTSEKIVMGDVLDKLGIHRLCCRSRILGHAM